MKSAIRSKEEAKNTFQKKKILYQLGTCIIWELHLQYSARSWLIRC